MNEQDADLNRETHMGEKSDNKDECAARLSKRVGSWGGGHVEATSPRVFVPLCLKWGAVKADEDEPQEREGRR